MNFFKTVWAALLAIVVANVLIAILMVLILAGIATALGDTPQVVKQNSILKIDLQGGIVDSPSNSPFGSVGINGIEFNRSVTILEALDAIDRASIDPYVEGIYINLSGGGASAANIEELRNALLRFKESGKFIISYGDVYSQFGYYLSSVADKVYMNPQGLVSWQGLSSNVIFYKGLLDKLGIQPEVMRHGSYKAAVEPYIMDRMSPENRHQMETLLGTIWGNMLHEISLSRGIDSTVLSNYATDLTMKSAEAAYQCGLIDGLMYEDQVMQILGRLTGGDVASLDSLQAQVLRPVSVSTIETADSSAVEQSDVTALEEDPEIISLREYVHAASPAVKKVSQNKVAVVYADGQIIDGESVDGAIGGATIAAKLAKVRKDDNVKAVVLRVNSPGGSALASEVMWREVELIRKEKPVVVSMGGVAASGGYYISCPADIILASPSTITGSIGVFGLLFNAEKGLKEKLGITVDVAKTNPSADLGSPFRPVSEQERAAIMFGIEQVYETFVGHVAAGRNLTTEAVDKIGGGRVWSGVSALEIGLIDGFGGLSEAIALAADRAGVAQDFRVWQVVDEPDNLTVMLNTLFSSRSAKLRSELGDAFVYYNSLRTVLSQQGVQARMPYEIEIQ